MTDQAEKKHSAFWGVMVIAGTVIGGGMFALPVDLAGAWFFWGAFILIIAWFSMLHSGLLLLEANLNYPVGSSFNTITKDLIGNTWNIISGITVAFVLYILTYAYISANGAIISETISMNLGYHANPRIVGICTAIFVASKLAPELLGAIAVAAYSYMALVPIVQPFCIRLATTRRERLIRMEYNPQSVTKTTRILFPILVTIVAGLAAPASVALVGFLMFGNLLRECGVLDGLSDTAQKVLANLVTLLLGLTVAFSMKAEAFLELQTLMIMGLGLVAFMFDTFGGVLFAKLLNLFMKKKINPMIGAAGISAFPMSSRVVHKMGLKEDPQNFLLMHAAAANVAGQIASVVAGGLIIALIG